MSRTQTKTKLGEKWCIISESAEFCEAQSWISITTDTGMRMVLCDVIEYYDGSGTWIEHIPTNGLAIKWVDIGHALKRIEEARARSY